MSNKDYEYAVYIGRFQPFHEAHRRVVEFALETANYVLIVVGSSHSAINVKNPWTFAQREEMILSCFDDERSQRIVCVPVRDYFYNENLWITEIQQIVSSRSNNSQSIALVGSFKDSSSYYLNSFPNWDFLPAKTLDHRHATLNATDIRNQLFSSNTKITKSSFTDLPRTVYGFIEKFLDTKEYWNLREEFEFIEEYKKKWSTSPFPPTFLTSDAVVVQSGHVLVVKRKFNPGKGLYALPGGFLKQSEDFKTGALRELREETSIKVSKIILENHIVDSKIFDYPGRSLRGRTVTNAFLIKLRDQDALPEVKANDDAEGVMWMSLADIYRNEDKFFEDHLHIIRYFTSKF